MGDTYNFGRGRSELANESFLEGGHHDLLKSPLLGGLYDRSRDGAAAPRIQVFERFVEVTATGLAARLPVS